MIREADKTFFLETNNTSYIFKVTKFGHLESIYYGKKLSDPDIKALEFKHCIDTGACVMYDDTDKDYCLDIIPLEFSGIGKGDYRFSPIEAKMPDRSFTTDFIFESFRITEEKPMSEVLPVSGAKDDSSMTLVITLKEKIFDIKLELYYSVYENEDVITRRLILQNNELSPVTIRKLMSMMLDLPCTNFTALTLHGGWIKEAQVSRNDISYGTFINSSSTGASSNRANPGLILFKEGCTENCGECYGFNIVYSGNHCEVVQRNQNGTTRIACGINPECFEWTLSENEAFETPETVITYSDKGLNGLSRHFHDFINKNIIPEYWRYKERPVLSNSWEACYFDFNQERLLKLADRAKSLGIELFVLDDGWFGNRNNDKAGLGDYTVNREKLPDGLAYLAEQINSRDMRFGIWVEPEMVNEDSDLYRAHPEYAVKIPGRKPSYGRNQLVLDITRKEVRDHIKEKMNDLLDSANIEYVKWDMNRHISDFYSEGLTSQGEFFHKYILGLYDLLRDIFSKRPHILLESCSSGGNRFDLGMLCFSPQIWASDNTDPIDRLNIQQGLSYFYPQSTLGAHVSDSPNQQTLRETCLSTRFNVAAFGLLGYEMDMSMLGSPEMEEIRNQIEFYKKWRALFQYGTFSRYDMTDPLIRIWNITSSDRRASVTGYYVIQSKASPENEILHIYGLDDEKRYEICVIPQKADQSIVNELIGVIPCSEIDGNGNVTIETNRNGRSENNYIRYRVSGALASSGISLANRFLGTGYNNRIRVLSDCGSELYLAIQERE